MQSAVLIIALIAIGLNVVFALVLFVVRDSKLVKAGSYQFLMLLLLALIVRLRRTALRSLAASVDRESPVLDCRAFCCPLCTGSVIDSSLMPLACLLVRDRCFRLARLFKL